VAGATTKIVVTTKIIRRSMRIATSFKRAPLKAAVYDAARAPQQAI